jgi:hypothetical protein
MQDRLPPRPSKPRSSASRATAGTRPGDSAPSDRATTTAWPCSPATSASTNTGTGHLSAPAADGRSQPQPCRDLAQRPQAAVHGPPTNPRPVDYLAIPDGWLTRWRSLAAANGVAAPRARNRPRSLEQTVDSISCPRTPCSSFAPVSVQTLRIVDHYKIDYSPSTAGLTCENLLRAGVTARVELRGFEPLTL